MAYQKRDWKDALQAAKSEGGGSNDTVDPREQKKRSRVMYKKRKLDKEVKNYVKNRYRINSKDIDTIGRRHGFQCHDMGGSTEGDG